MTERSMWTPLSSSMSRSCLAGQKAAFRHARPNPSSATWARQASPKAMSTSAQSATASRSIPLSAFILVGGGTSLLAFKYQASKPIRCEYSAAAGRPYAEARTVGYQGPGSSNAARRDASARVESSIDLKNLSFGAVAGITTGIFIKKGLKAAGFLFGGAFILFQASGSSLVH
ncbi:hypothetical protein EMMF5_002165 [Cystobasidiomycetes sp. EMM_F5]